jgi:hypothetical protein
MLISFVTTARGRLSFIVHITGPADVYAQLCDNAHASNGMDIGLGFNPHAWLRLMPMSHGH